MTTLLEGLINIYKLSKELVINKLAISCTVVYLALHCNSIAG